MNKKRLAVAVAAVLLLGGGIWYDLRPVPKVQPYAPQDTQIRDTSATPTLNSGNDTQTVDNPTLPVAPTPDTILEADSSSYPATKVNTPSFMTPEAEAYSWTVNFSYSNPTTDDHSVTVRVIDSVSGLPVNLVVLSPAANSGSFSFFEQHLGNPVYIEISPGTWHLSVTAGEKALYTPINTTTIQEMNCVKNLQGQCTYGPPAN